MLKKAERLTKKEFDSAFSKGKRLHSPLLQLIYVKSGPFHGAAVAGKKVHKSAVVRNKVRRRVYAALYALKKELGLEGVYILVAKPAAKEVTFSAIKSELRDLVGRIQ